MKLKIIISIARNNNNNNKNHNFYFDVRFLIRDRIKAYFSIYSGRHFASQSSRIASQCEGNCLPRFFIFYKKFRHVQDKGAKMTGMRKISEILCPYPPSKNFRPAQNKG